MKDGEPGSRELKATPEEAREFLARYASRIHGALAGQRRTAERRLAQFAIEGADKFEPDDLDGMTEAFRGAYVEAGEAMAELDRLAPLQRLSIDVIKGFLDPLDRIFPESGPDGR